MQRTLAAVKTPEDSAKLSGPGFSFRASLPQRGNDDSCPRVRLFFGRLGRHVIPFFSYRADEHGHVRCCHEPSEAPTPDPSCQHCGIFIGRAADFGDIEETEDIQAVIDRDSHNLVVPRHLRAPPARALRKKSRS